MQLPTKIPFFGARKLAWKLVEEVRLLQGELSRLGVLTLAEMERRRQALASEIAAQEQLLRERGAEAEVVIARRRAHAELEQKGLERKLAALRDEIVATEEVAVLQEAGIYRCRHPLSDSVAYARELERLNDAIKAMTKKDGGAVLCGTAWLVNDSAAQGRTMLREYSKLMLRAYNAEADNLVRGMKPYKLDVAIERLEKVAATIERLGKTMDIRVAPSYHALRLRELELTADHLDRLAEEKEREREERARAKEERAAQRELERERERLEKERAHCENALQALVKSGDEAGASRMREQLADVDRAIEDVDYRAANIRAGYVYVISNVGAFGERLVKIGMTRRLNPMERVDELGDASVPFRFDVHALFFSADAVGIELQLHERLADRRVNLVNTRREFFYATPAEVREHLLALTGELLQYQELAEAVEFRQSESARASQRLAAWRVSGGQPVSVDHPPLVLAGGVHAA